MRRASESALKELKFDEELKAGGRRSRESVTSGSSGARNSRNLTVEADTPNDGGAPPMRSSRSSRGPEILEELKHAPRSRMKAGVMQTLLSPTSQTIAL